MDSKKKSIMFWLIFILIIATVVLFGYYKFSFLSKDINKANAETLAARLSSSTAANYTLRKSNHLKGITIANCLDVVNISGNVLPTGYQIMSQVILSDQVVFCTLTAPKIEPIQFSVIGIT